MNIDNEIDNPTIPVEVLRLSATTCLTASCGAAALTVMDILPLAFLGGHALRIAVLSATIIIWWTAYAAAYLFNWVQARRPNSPPFPPRGVDSPFPLTALAATAAALTILAPDRPGPDSSNLPDTIGSLATIFTMVAVLAYSAIQTRRLYFLLRPKPESERGIVVKPD